VTFLHSESDISSFLRYGQDVAFATLPGILAVLAIPACASYNSEIGGPGTQLLE
jgi:hypothetical protein